MINFVHGDLLKSDCQALVNPVNCVGVMGRGLALQFKKKFPDYFENYKSACDHAQIYPGTLHIYDVESQDKITQIISFPTKLDWRQPSNIDFINIGMDLLDNHIINSGIQSIAIPKLGCANGGLDWKEVKPVILSYLSPYDNAEVNPYYYRKQIVIYE